jgi:hypothetical protein
MRPAGHTELVANAVGERLGFSDATVFTQFFRQRTGMIPAAFRVHARGTDAPIRLSTPTPSAQRPGGSRDTFIGVNLIAEDMCRPGVASG